MAITFTLRDNDSNIIYDLYSGTLYASTETWMTSVSSGVVNESISLSGSGTNAALRTAFDTLDDIRAQVVRYANDPNEDNAIYLYKVTDGETSKRTLILDMVVTPENIQGASSLLENEGVKVSLDLVHPEFWEESSTSSKSGGDLDNVDWTNPSGAITSITGNIDARMSRILFSHSSGQVNRVWFGMRPRRMEQVPGLGNAGSESPIFEIENGTVGTDTTLLGVSGASPNGSSSNNYHGCNFATDASMKRRTYFTLNDQLGSTYNRLMHWAGRYKVLLRYRLTVSPATEVLVQLRYGMSGNATLGASRPVYLTEGIAGWDIKEIGSINIPPWADYKYGDGLYASNDINNVQFEVWAELVVGTQSTSYIDLDAIIIIPAEHFIYVEGANLTGINEHIVVFTAPNGMVFTFEDDTGTSASKTLLASHNNFFLPYGSSDFVAAIARSDGTHVMTDEVDITILLREAYFNYVG